MGEVKRITRTGHYGYGREPFDPGDGKRIRASQELKSRATSQDPLIRIEPL